MLGVRGTRGALFALACAAALALGPARVQADDYYEQVAVAPETTITKQPRNKLKTRIGQTKKRIVYEFVSSIAGSTFTCTLDGKTAPCEPRFAKRVRKGRHAFSVAATSPGGVADPTPATDAFRVKRRRR